MRIKMISAYLRLKFREVKRGINKHPGHGIRKQITQAMWDYIFAELRLNVNTRFAKRVRIAITDQLINIVTMERAKIIQHIDIGKKVSQVICSQVGVELKTLVDDKMYEIEFITRTELKYKIGFYK